MPMQLLRRIGIVENIHRHLLAFFEADERTGELTVVRDSREDLVRRNFDGSGLDMQSVIGSNFGFGGEKMFWTKQECAGGQASGPEELAPRFSNSFHRVLLK